MLPYQIQNNTRIYDFEETMKFLSNFGKSKFGPQFNLLKSDAKILYLLSIYAIRDHENCEKHDLDLNKGILLVGKVGCGKTSLMDLFRILHYREFHYLIKSTRDIGAEYENMGVSVINKYGTQPKIYCFDDLGVEQQKKHFGNDCNTMAEILLYRYELLRNFGIVTHATTNLNADELEKLYGNRVRSRLREMFNLVSFPLSVQDKRK